MDLKVSTSFLIRLVMISSLTESLKVVAPYLSPQLVSPETISHISQVTSFFPAMPVVIEAGFECRLGIDEPIADFLLSVDASYGGRDFLIGTNSKAELPAAFFTNRTWSAIREFCKTWANPASSLHKNVNSIWLEFDIDGSLSSIPIPSFFFGSDRICSKNSDLFSHQSNGCDRQWLTNVALKTLLGSYLLSPIEQNLLKCISSLPNGAEIFQVGVMLSRQSESSLVRLCVRGIPKSQILEYLLRIGWNNSIDDLKYVVSTLSRFADDILLNFAIGSTVLPKIGFECHFDRKHTYDPKFRLFLDYLVESQLCTLSKRDALLTWTGYSRQNLDRDLSPSHLVKTASFLGSRVSSICMRRVNHIKITYQPHKPLTAKGYLWFAHRCINSRSLNTRQLAIEA